jgi:hypothetical protein
MQQESLARESTVSGNSTAASRRASNPENLVPGTIIIIACIIDSLRPRLVKRSCK